MPQYDQANTGLLNAFSLQSQPFKPAGNSKMVPFKPTMDARKANKQNQAPQMSQGEFMNGFTYPNMNSN